MSANSIVIAFNVTEDFRACLLNRFKDAAFNQFRLKREKKRVALRIVAKLCPCRSYFAENH